MAVSPPKVQDSKALADFCELEYGVPLLDLAAFDLDGKFGDRYRFHRLVFFLSQGGNYK